MLKREYFILSVIHLKCLVMDGSKITVIHKIFVNESVHREDIYYTSVLTSSKIKVQASSLDYFIQRADEIICTRATCYNCITGC